MELRFKSILFVGFFICVLSCGKSNDDFLTTLEGNYEGTFTVEYKNDETFSNPVEVSFSEDQFSSTTGTDRFPAGGNGTYKVENNTIQFTDKNIWTADFDWNLILNGTYNYTINKNTLTLSANKNDVGFYKYVLEKK
ncbi:hypothetical protein FVB32_01205 [Flagellimonas hymeniacidonis]|uniref:Lipocalin-like domain-containing protein n=1 Tax=Flagellimonas hymeniacidonis TaxID=2603628 RepID=A0A5C8V4I5_9FLAO|nr:hypothetical protein [Flagellimonas hymeniacidonis]TXN36934.1 hypothetical protein FVB32_01205 [Flagellimonas hymeniacidonis]